MNLCIAAVGCCTRGALALGGGAFLLRAGETRGCFVAPAHDAPHGESLTCRYRCCTLLFCCASVTASSARACVLQNPVLSAPLCVYGFDATQPPAQGLRSESRRYRWCVGDQEPHKDQTRTAAPVKPVKLLNLVFGVVRTTRGKMVQPCCKIGFHSTF